MKNIATDKAHFPRWPVCLPAGYDRRITWPESMEAVVSGPAVCGFDAWTRLVRCVRAGASTNRLDQARAAVAAVLVPSTATSSIRGGALELAQQMTADVSAVSPAQRAEAMTELGATALPFVQAVWACDMSVRAGSAFANLFGENLLEDAMVVGPVDDSPSWPAQEQFLRDVARLDRLDPVTSELVRLRGARAHDCRLCQSLRSRRAVEAAGGAELFEPLEPFDPAIESRPDGRGGLTERHRTAVRLVDAFVWQPTAWPEDLAEAVRAAFAPDEAVELVLDVVRNAANKIAVAFGADDPHVTEGVEYYDIDFSSGELVYGLPPV